MLSVKLDPDLTGGGWAELALELDLDLLIELNRVIC